MKTFLLTPVCSAVADPSLRLSSHPATPTAPQSAELVETAQPIRTLAIKLEEGEEGCEMQSKEKAMETEEQLEVTRAPSCSTWAFQRF